MLNEKNIYFNNESKLNIFLIFFKLFFTSFYFFFKKSSNQNNIINIY